MSLSDCRRYHEAVDLAAEKYLQICGDFAKSPTVAGWRAYMEASAPLYAAVWLSFFWRMHLKTQSSTLANKAGMSQFHYGQMLGDVQERLQTLEEDSSFREQIVEIANQVWPLVLTRSEK